MALGQGLMSVYLPLRTVRRHAFLLVMAVKLSPAMVPVHDGRTLVLTVACGRCCGALVMYRREISQCLFISRYERSGKAHIVR